MSPSQRRQPRTQATPAERLVKAFAAGNDDGVRDAAADIIGRGLRGAFDVALRLVRREFEPEAETEFRAVILEAAETADEPHEAATLLVAGAVIGGEGCPDPGALARDLPDSGAFDRTERVRFHPAWIVAQDVEAANPCDIRAALRSLLAGAAPDPFRPASPERLREGGVFALLGTVRRSVSDLPQAESGDEGEREAERRRQLAEAEARSDAFEVWAERAAASQPGLQLIVEPTTPSWFDAAGLEELGLESPENDPDTVPHTADELVEFVEAARAETADRHVACSVAQRDGALDVEVRATSGTVLDRRAFALGADEALHVLRPLERVTLEQPR